MRGFLWIGKKNWLLPIVNRSLLAINTGAISGSCMRSFAAARARRSTTQSSIALFERVDDFGSVVGSIRLLGAVLGHAIDGVDRGCRSAFLAPTGDEANAQQCDHNDLQVRAVHKTPKLSISAGESPSPSASTVAMLNRYHRHRPGRDARGTTISLKNGVKKALSQRQIVFIRY